ncbi:putative GPI transamidase component Tta1 [Leishmania mexicana MHOM/GT/2001/U1103]|uniref:GPI transamidase component Tta1 n=1 Tax=Leishmania mexicana (strain MHOM/GT/2001/U1103) TaxID=929439 RepID=E9B335_LEIMU|nr:putative GPI transamidase component Tta1 [Leishmania mexicana MHOM/GT/2001/U1103]CBZ29651.1 putative GPI transamidase component Tta1 [Leishmania mexicana MHOM/GT/2001/U1103]
MPNSPSRTKSTAVMAAPSETWRRNSTNSFAALSAFIFLVVIGVHWTTVSREHVELPMDRVLADLRASCSTLEDTPALTSASLPPAFYGLGVWVDSPALLPSVHAALALMKERLADVLNTAAAAVPLPTHTLYTFVRLQSQVRDEVVAALVTEAQSGRSLSAKRVMRRLEHLTNEQQLGLPTLKHAFLPEVGQEVELLGLSLFSVPASALPGDAASKVQCFVADVRQAYCVLPVEEPDASNVAASSRARYSAASLTPLSYRLRAASLEAEVRAALLSVVTQQTGLASFKPADVAAWKQSREHQGCLYTITSATSTMRSIAANTNMAVPQSTERMFAVLERHVRSGSFLRAARAADDLQFHPSLTPQLYIPWDHSLISQLIVLLPMVSCTLLAARSLVEERWHSRARAKAAAQAQDAKKGQ